MMHLYRLKLVVKLVTDEPRLEIRLGKHVHDEESKLWTMNHVAGTELLS